MEASLGTEPSANCEAWLESAATLRGVRPLLERRGWRVMDDVSGELIAEPAIDAARGPASYRLYLHYAARAQALAELDAWYAQEHEQLLVLSKAWCRIRRFRTGDALQPGRLVVHDVSDPLVLESVELRAAMSTPWRARLASMDWFSRSSRQVWQILPTSLT